ncbi:hypothetical protein EPN95_04455 [Patescibacteria group bacterium]|nr:MAG: hypothetical protein EPN95_04455 [Patescibacteria group bacterium]
MKKTITTQEELDLLTRIEADDEIIIKTHLKLNARLAVFGRIVIDVGLECRWNDGFIVSMDGKSSIESWGNSSPSIESWENSSPSIESWENSVLRVLSSEKKLSIRAHGFSVLSLPIGISLDLQQEKTCTVLRRQPQKFLDRDGVPVADGKVTLYKRVSADFKTQEGTRNETLWQVGSTVTHPAWSPEASECGEGKFHACSRSYFADEFRSERGDRYVAIEIAVEDLYEWPNPRYPHKIAFRSGVVVGEVDRFGRKK